MGTRPGPSIRLQSMLLCLTAGEQDVCPSIAMRAWAEDLLGETRLKREGYFHPAPIRHKWQDQQSGTRNGQFDLWDILMFQAWLNR